MNTDKLKSLIETSELNQMQKNIHLGFVARAENLIYICKIKISNYEMSKM